MKTAPTTILIEQKLAAFDRLQPEFVSSFQFVQALHGQQRLYDLTLTTAVRYLHARWVLECKDRLLSVPRMMRSHEGRRCLELLAAWQDGDTASVISYLQDRLDAVPFGFITRQIQEARLAGGDGARVARLEHGRLVMLNRTFHFLSMFEAICTLPAESALAAVCMACAAFDHTPELIAHQLAEFVSPLFAPVRHPALTRRNMMLMNELGVGVIVSPNDLPGRRSWKVMPTSIPPGPFAQTLIPGYRELTAPLHNNLRDVRFFDKWEPDASSSAAQP